MQLRARATETTPLRIGEREYTTVRVNFNGYTRRRLPSMGAEGTYAATAWYAPELKRVVRFQVDMPLRQGSSSYARADELLELVDIRSE
jgi:serine protease Do